MMFTVVQQWESFIIVVLVCVRVTPSSASWLRDG